jgi:sugar lactone lactonase YvrE
MMLGIGILYTSCTTGKLSGIKTSLFVSADVFTKEVEGVASDLYGNVYAVNWKERGTVGIVKPSGEAALFIRLPEGSTGNGIRFDRQGRMYIADYTAHNILVADTASRQVQVWVHEPAMNQPNDLAIAPDGTLYASDPNWKENTGQLWRIAPNGRASLLSAGMGTTNGIEVSPDGRWLYVNESVQRNIWRFDLSANDIGSSKTLFYTFPDFGLDGMRCDARGNLYVSRYGKGTVVVLRSSGRQLAEIQLQGSKPSNLDFGGEKGRTVYVSLQDNGQIECFTAPHPGRAWRELNRHFSRKK